jgi:hypothetical protein
MCNPIVTSTLTRMNLVVIRGSSRCSSISGQRRNSTREGGGDGRCEHSAQDIPDSLVALEPNSVFFEAKALPCRACPTHAKAPQSPRICASWKRCLP